MSWKKTWFSHILWALYSVIVCALLCRGIFTLISDTLGLHMIIGIICLFFVIWIGLWFLIQKLISKRKRVAFIRTKRWVIVEWITVIAIIAAGVIGYGFLLSNIGLSEVEQSRILQNSFINVDAAVNRTASCSEWVYICVLRMLFLFVGNNTEAALWLQFILQIAAAFIIYRGMCKISNRIISVATLVGLTGISFVLLPQTFVSPSWLSFFLFSIGFYCLTLVFNNVNKIKPDSRKKIIFYGLGMFILGLYISILSYIDIYNIVLILPGISLLWSSKGNTINEHPNGKNRIIQVICLIAGGIMGFFIILLIEAACYKISITQTVSNWWSAYSVEINLNIYNNFSNSVCTLFVLLCAILFFAVPGFWKEKKKSLFDGFYFIWIGTITFYILGIGFWEYEIIYVLTVMMICSIYCVGKCFMPKEVMIKNDVDVHKELNNALQESENVGPTEEDKSVIKFLENPLPGPKKHVPKKLDYDLQNDELNNMLMDYDIDIKDEDDFDL